MMSRTIRCLGKAGVVLTLLAGLTAQASRAEPVKIGELGSFGDAAFYIALEKGYFKKHKVDVSLERFSSAVQAMPSLSTNQIQVAGGGMSAALFNAFARGWSVRIAMARSRDMAGYSPDVLVLRKDLESTVKSLRDLKGKKVAINAPQGALHFMLGKMMDSAGLKLSDLDIVYMPWTDMLVAFQSKAIDAGKVIEPFVSQFAERNVAIPFVHAADAIKDPPFEISVVLYNSDWASQNVDQANAFTAAYLEGVRDYYDAMRGGPKRKEVIDIMVKYTSQKDPTIYDRIQWGYMDPNATLELDSLRDQQDWYVSQGVVSQKVDINKMIDRRFIDNAVKTLGRVSTK